MTTPATCAVCGGAFHPKRRGQQREQHCPECRRWRFHRLRNDVALPPPPAPVARRPTRGGTWPELVAAELDKDTTP